MRPKDHLIKLHTKIDTKIKKSSLNKLNLRPKTNLIKLHTCHSRVTPDLKLTQMIQ